MSLGFYFDMERCIGCRACQVACKDRYGFELAGVRPRRVFTYESANVSNVGFFNMSISCNHCENPACTDVCPTGAMFKAEDGTVQHDDDVCISCQSCVKACPYGAPQLSDEIGLIVKCDSCKALRDAGMNPVCVDACVMRALDFGEIDELKAKYGEDLVCEVSCLPSASATNPNLLIKPRRQALDEACVEVPL